MTHGADTTLHINCIHHPGCTLGEPCLFLSLQPHRALIAIVTTLSATSHRPPNPQDIRHSDFFISKYDSSPNHIPRMYLQSYYKDNIQRKAKFNSMPFYCSKVFNDFSLPTVHSSDY